MLLDLHAERQESLCWTATPRTREGGRGGNRFRHCTMSLKLLFGRSYGIISCCIHRRLKPLKWRKTASFCWNLCADTAIECSTNCMWPSVVRVWRGGGWQRGGGGGRRGGRQGRGRMQTSCLAFGFLRSRHRNNCGPWAEGYSGSPFSNLALYVQIVSQVCMRTVVHHQHSWPRRQGQHELMQQGCPAATTVQESTSTLGYTFNNRYTHSTQQAVPAAISALVH